MARLASLLESHPYLATPAKVAILSKPLPLAEQRQWQSQLPGIADNCPAIVRLLGDMSLPTMLPPGTVWQSVIGTRYPVWRCMHGFRPNNDNRTPGNIVR